MTDETDRTPEESPSTATPVSDERDLPLDTVDKVDKAERPTQPPRAPRRVESEPATVVLPTDDTADTVVITAVPKTATTDGEATAADVTDAAVTADAEATTTIATAATVTIAAEADTEAAAAIAPATHTEAAEAAVDTSATMDTVAFMAVAETSTPASTVEPTSATEHGGSGTPAFAIPPEPVGASAPQQPVPVGPRRIPGAIQRPAALQPGRNRWIAVAAGVAVVMALIVGLAVHNSAEADKSAGAQIKRTIATFDEALSTGDLATLRSITAGRLADFYKNADERRYAQVYQDSVARKTLPVIDSIDAIQVTGSTALAQVTLHLPDRPADKSPRTYNLRETPDGWKVSD